MPLTASEGHWGHGRLRSAWGSGCVPGPWASCSASPGPRPSVCPAAPLTFPLVWEKQRERVAWVTERRGPAGPAGAGPGCPSRSGEDGGGAGRVPRWPRGSAAPRRHAPCRTRRGRHRGRQPQTGRGAGTRRSPAMPSPDFVFPLTGKVHARRADTASRGALSGPTAPSQAEPTAVSPWLPGRHLLVRLRPWCAAQTYSGTQKRPEPPSGVRGPWVRGGCRTPHAPDPAVPRGAAESSTG